MKKLLFNGSLVFAASFLMLPCTTSGQQALTLEQCIENALQNNLSLMQASNSTLLATYQLKQSRMDFFPSLSASLNANRSQGRYIDAFTFSSAANPITSGVNVFSAYPLFNAFARWHNLRSSNYSLKATENAHAALENDICTQVTWAFIQVVYDRENLKITDGKLKLLEKQQEKTEALVQAGVKTEGDVLTVKAQAASEKVNLVNRKNQYNKDLLTLIQLMNMDPSEIYEVVAPDTTTLMLNEKLPSLDSVFSIALRGMPDVKEKEYRVLASMETMKSSKSVFFPSLTANFSGSSNYSSNRKVFLRNDTLGGVVFPVYDNNHAQPYFNQLTDYFYFNAGFSLNVPIFNNYRNTLSYQRSTINYENAKIDYDNSRNNLVKEIQQAYLDAQSAKARFDASLEQLVSLDASLDYSETKYEAGLVDFYTYSEILNNRTQAQIELTTARYDYLLKMKILDLYQGKELKF